LATVDRDIPYDFERNVGLALRGERERKGWTLAMVSEPIGISASGVYRIEAAERAFHMDRLADLCLVLGVPPTDIVRTAETLTFPDGWPRDE
jgi:transcriptional regulator with XRE-family HTH domain